MKRSDLPRVLRQGLLVICLLGLLLAGCETQKTTTAVDDVPEESTTLATDLSQSLVVGTSATAPPLVFREGEKVVGLEIDLAHELGRRLNRKVRIVTMFFPNLPYELKNRRINIIMAGMSVTDQRKVEMAFASPYFQTGQQAMVHTSKATEIDSSNKVDKSKYRIGVENGTTAAAYVAESIRNAEVMEFATLAEAVEALQRKQIQIVIHDAATLRWLVRNDTTDTLRTVPGLMTDEPIAWAMHPSDAELLKDVNAALEAMRADGTLKQLTEKWAGE